jgi:hypothetical protein
MNTLFGDYTKAKSLLKKLYEIASKSDNPSALDGYNGISGMVYVMEGNPSKALEFFNERISPANYQYYSYFKALALKATQNKKEANEIFLATNNTKNVELRYLPQTKLQNICNRLIDRYPKSITNNKTGKANLHRLDKKQLYNLIQFNDSCNNENNTEDYLFEKIVSLNLKLSNQSYEELFGSKRTSQRKGKSYDGAQKEGFYLGLKNDTQLAILFQTFI